MSKEKINKIRPYTMVSQERCENIVNLVKNVNKEIVEGCLIECGVWKCGIVGLMSLIDDEFGSTREVIGIDSFKYELFPVSLESCKENLKEMNAERVILYEGFFNEIIPKIINNIKNISILRLDASHYDATMFCLDQLYDKISVGGYIVIDDYGDYVPCKKAIDDFRKKRLIEDPFFYTDYTEIWWKKTK